MRIGVFGGSFDPVHHGHLIAAEYAAEALELDQVRLVPAAGQPLKPEGPRAPARDRLDLLEAAVAGHPRFVVDDRELRRPPPSYTVDTLRELRVIFPQDQLFLMVGADAMRAFPRWREAAALRDLARVVVLRRPGAELPAAETHVHVVDTPLLEISAREIRARVARGLSVRYLVPDGVARLIAERRLYAEGV